MEYPLLAKLVDTTLTLLQCRWQGTWARAIVTVTCHHLSSPHKPRESILRWKRGNTQAERFLGPTVGLVETVHVAQMDECLVKATLGPNVKSPSGWL